MKGPDGEVLTGNTKQIDTTKDLGDPFILQEINRA